MAADVLTDDRSGWNSDILTERHTVLLTVHFTYR